MENDRSLTKATKDFLDFWKECIDIPEKNAIFIYIKKLVFYTRVESLEINTRFMESIKDIKEDFNGCSYKIDITAIPEEYRTAVIFLLMKQIRGQEFVHNLDNLLPNEVSALFNISAKLYTADDHYSDHKKMIKIAL